MGCRVDHHLVPLGQDLACQRINLRDALHLVTEELHAKDRLLARRLHLNGVPSDTELGATECGVVALVLKINEVAQDRIAAVLPCLAHAQDRCAVVHRCAKTVDAADRGDDDRVPSLKERLRRRVSQLINLVVAARVLLDVGVRARKIRLWLVVVEVGDEVLNRVLWKELL